MFVWSDWIEQIILALVIAVITFVIGFSFDKYVRMPIRRRLNSLRFILPFGSGDEVTICYGLIPPGTTGRNYVAEEGDLAAIYVTYDIFAFLFNRKGIRIQSHMVTKDNLSTYSNLVSISGPKWNRVTEMLIGELGSPVFFSKLQGNIVYHTSKNKVKEYKTIRNPPHLAERCYGLILSGIIERSDGSKQRVLICAGNTTLSMFGTTTYLKSLSNARKLRNPFRKHGISNDKRWGMILEVENNIPDRDGLVFLPMNPAVIHVRVVDYISEKEFRKPYAYQFEKA